MNQVKKTGGGRIGFANATWPFVTLVATKDKLELKASILDNYVFRPSDVISLEPYSHFLRSGIKINHCVQNYPQEVVLLTSNPEALIYQIHQLGFIGNVNRTTTGFCFYDLPAYTANDLKPFIFFLCLFAA